MLQESEKREKKITKKKPQLQPQNHTRATSVAIRQPVELYEKQVKPGYTREIEASQNVINMFLILVARKSATNRTPP